MTLIIGLGNPGENFDSTPHNVGFDVIEAFVKENGFSEFKLQKKSEALISSGVINGTKIIVAKPQTFMNNSGKTAKSLVGKNKEQEVIVVHDDIDLAFGRIKISKNRGSAGHKGVESIIEAIGNENFVRVRIGVMPAEGKPKEPEKFVLKKIEIPENVILKASGIVKLIAINGLEKAMDEINRQ